MKSSARINSSPLPGLSLQPIFGLCKLLWLKQQQPEIFVRTVRWLNIADYIAFRLCGEQATDFSLASRTLALDIRQHRWADDILQAVDIRPDILAPLCASGTTLGPVQPDAATVTGLPVTAQVAAGGHDHVCGALAAGVNAPGLAMNSLGTSETMFVSLDQPLTDASLGRRGYTQGAHVIAGLYYVFGALYTSGGSVEWFRSTLADNRSYAELIAEAEAVPPGSKGICFLPHLQLASPPYDDPLARGAFIGLGTEIDRAAMFRAVLEGISYDSRLMLESLLAYEGGSPTANDLRPGRRHAQSPVDADQGHCPQPVADGYAGQRCDQPGRGYPGWAGRRRVSGCGGGPGDSSAPDDAGRTRI
jgi:xylulokinase